MDHNVLLSYKQLLSELKQFSENLTTNLEVVQSALAEIKASMLSSSNESTNITPICQLAAPVDSEIKVSLTKTPPVIVDNADIKMDNIADNEEAEVVVEEVEVVVEEVQVPPVIVASDNAAIKEEVEAVVEAQGALKVFVKNPHEEFLSNAIKVFGKESHEVWATKAYYAVDYSSWFTAHTTRESSAHKVFEVMSILSCWVSNDRPPWKPPPRAKHARASISIPNMKLNYVKIMERRVQGLCYNYSDKDEAPDYHTISEAGASIVEEKQVHVVSKLALGGHLHHQTMSTVVLTVHWLSSLKYVLRHYAKKVMEFAGKNKVDVAVSTLRLMVVSSLVHPLMNTLKAKNSLPLGGVELHQKLHIGYDPLPTYITHHCQLFQVNKLRLGLLKMFDLLPQLVCRTRPPLKPPDIKYLYKGAEGTSNYNWSFELQTSVWKFGNIVITRTNTSQKRLWIYGKAQEQSNVQESVVSLMMHHKLGERHGGLLCITYKAGQVAYELYWPQRSDYQNISEVSLCKLFNGTSPVGDMALPLHPNTVEYFQPNHISAIRILNTEGQLIKEYLVRCNDPPREVTSLENFTDIGKDTPNLNLEDKVVFDGRRNDTSQDDSYKVVNGMEQRAESQGKVSKNNMLQKNNRSASGKIVNKGSYLQSS